MKYNWSQTQRNKQRTKFKSIQGSSQEEVEDQSGTVML